MKEEIKLNKCAESGYKELPHLKHRFFTNICDVKKNRFV